MRKSVRRRARGWGLLADTSGAVALLVGLALPVLAGVGMLGVDAGVWYWERRNLQTAADSAAIAAAYELMQGQAGNPNAAALQDAQRNAFTGVGITVSSPPLTGVESGNTQAVAVTLERPLPLFYANILGAQAAVVRATATALVDMDDEFCVLGLDQTASNAVEVFGNANLTMNCGMAVNSNHSNALRVQGNVSVNMTDINVVGGVRITGNPTITTDQPMSLGVNPFTDPYADLTVPIYGGCDHNNTTVGGTVTLSPGVYCGNFNINSHATANLEPGVYIFNNVPLNINAQSVVQGSGVTLILTGSGSSYSRLTINGGGTLDISAPSSGTYAGVAMFQDRNANTNGEHIINGGATVNVRGAMYFPAQQLTFRGNAAIAPGCLQLIARMISFGGTASVSNTVCDETGASPIGSQRVRLVR